MLRGLPSGSNASRRGGGRFGLRLDGIAADGVENFLAMDGNVIGRLDSKAYLVAAHLYHSDDNVVADDNSFVALSR